MILFIDTHDELITIALKNNNQIYVKTKLSEYSHSVYTMPLIEEIFKENNLDIKDIKKIIVVNGPGSFTGIRIGLSIAKTIAYALKININPISSLTAYLVSHETTEDKKAVIEDNKGYYVSVFDKNNNVMVEETYVEEDTYNYKKVENKLDVEKIINYCENIESENPHFIKANYIKKIEVEK